MKGEGFFSKTWKKIVEWRWWVSGVIVTALLISIAIFFFSVSNFPDKTGFNGKTLWDALDLLIIPIVLALGAFFLNRAQRRNELEIAKEEHEAERRIAKDREEESAVQNYLEAMTKLLLEQGLRTSEEGSEVRSIARARTLTVLRNLNGERKGSILRFLHDANLINAEKRVVDLSGANLSKADLSMADLSGAYLSKADLSEAKLNLANLRAARMNLANLSGADLREAYLRGARLSEARLNEANLREASLNVANLTGANLRGANLREANLGAANLSGADLRGADMNGANRQGATMREAKYDDETVWPEGFDLEKAGAIKVD